MSEALPVAGDVTEAVPLVSIVMATYNCAATLGEALASIEAQTYPCWELVVCDDASTDSTPAMLAEFADDRPGRVTVLVNEVNSKLSFSLNRCLEVARGDLVARMDGDDISQPRRLEQQVSFLRDHPEIDLVGTAMQRFDANGLNDVLVMPASPDRFSMRKGVPFAHATVMVRAHVYAVLGGYTVSARTVRGQDKDLWFRFFHAGFKGANLLEPLYLVRENLNAIRRRDLRTRINSYRTSLVGFRLLGFPFRWYVAPTLELAKLLVPARAVVVYRARQARRAARRTD